MSASRSPWPGIAASSMGLALFVLARLSPEAANAPLFVVDAAAGAFFFAGISIIADAWRAPLLGRLSVLAVIYLLAVPGLWMLFGTDIGRCSVGIAIGGAGASGASDPLPCRIAFGAGGLLTLAIALAFTWGLLRKRRNPANPDPAA